MTRSLANDSPETTDRTFDALSRLDAVDAFKLACMESGKGLDAIAREMGWSLAHAKRIVSTARYFPTYEDLPRFCAVVGNRLVLEWLLVSARRLGVPSRHDALSCNGLIFRIGELFSEAGDVGQAGQEAIADQRLEPVELRRLIKELRDVVVKALTLIGDLRTQERALVAAPRARA